MSKAVTVVSLECAFLKVESEDNTAHSWGWESRQNHHSAGPFSAPVYDRRPALPWDAGQCLRSADTCPTWYPSTCDHLPVTGCAQGSMTLKKTKAGQERLQN